MNIANPPNNLSGNLSGRSSGKLTPLMQQYWDVKSAHEDKVVLFRMGDFYEMFHRDAEIAAPVLGIALTSRNKKSADETPMCGVPHHSIGPQINKLLAAGFKVAIVDQLEDPKLAKGIVKRGVTRVLSPGVVYDPDTLDSLTANYLASFDDQHLAFLDTTTGEAFFYELRHPSQLPRILGVLQPVEIVLAPGQLEIWERVWPQHIPITLSEVKAASEVEDSAIARLTRYAESMQGSSAQLFAGERFERRELSHRLELSPTCIRHLEVFETYKGETRGSLFAAINRCQTSSGARLLKSWMRFPLAQAPAIERRLDDLQFYFTRTQDLEWIRKSLSRMGDIERRLGKIANPSCHVRDLLALAETLQTGVSISDYLHQLDRSLNSLNTNESEVELAREISAQIQMTLLEEPPMQMKNGHFIRTGVSPVLDELITLSENSQALILGLEAREKEQTGISSLKVRYNNVFGYYIEITHTHKDKIPKERYERKQTLANAERFITKELEELEHKVLTAQSRRLELEFEIFENLRARVLKVLPLLLTIAKRWSELDATTALAWLAIEQRYVRPRFSAQGHLHLKASRHPVVEQVLREPFIANQISVPAHHTLLLTGPNMAGKSTLMRQVAVSAILAQMGSFVPADDAELPIFDQIFTRIGASDFLSEGLSTFMVEMQETAEMLKLATPQSLVVLDEIGRGTSTFDGMSLAQAILEFLLSDSRAMTLFATHYHELTGLKDNFPTMINAHMAIHEKAGQISFLHTLTAGPANKSYGIHVAKLAGLPVGVTKRAGQILKTLETRGHQLTPQLSFLDQASDFSVADESLDEPNATTPALSAEEQKILDSLKGLDSNQLTPLEALNTIAQWRQSLS
jgi:DNA mismatch repair protein MutS